MEGSPVTAAAPGRHRRAPLHQRLLASWRAARQRRHVEAARDDAYVVRIEAHAPSPRARAWATVASLRAITDAFGMPPAAVLPDVDIAGLDHLRKPDWKYATDTFAAYVDGMEP